MSMIVTAEAVQLSGQPRWALWQAVRNGLLSPPLKISHRKVFWSRIEIEAFAKLVSNLPLTREVPHVAQ